MGWELVQLVVAVRLIHVAMLAAPEARTAKVIQSNVIAMLVMAYGLQLRSYCAVKLGIDLPRLSTHYPENAHISLTVAT